MVLTWFGVKAGIEPSPRLENSRDAVGGDDEEGLNTTNGKRKKEKRKKKKELKRRHLTQYDASEQESNS